MCVYIRQHYVAKRVLDEYFTSGCYMHISTCTVQIHVHVHACVCGSMPNVGETPRGCQLMLFQGRRFCRALTYEHV